MRREIRYALLCAALFAGACDATEPRVRSVTPETSTAEKQPFKDANGKACELGLGATLCPTVKEIGEFPLPSDMRGDFLTVFQHCVSSEGKAENIVIAKSSENQQYDTRAQRQLADSQFIPGTVEGRPERICGVKTAIEVRTSR
ncbi:MAG TPA: hypothetical protein VGO52_13340 [Hyphomonadaceae bacterium]|jgi:hypothetical protein|nr:hypothetical protein [Hyphomonadaceae bacterium]